MTTAEKKPTAYNVGAVRAIKKHTPEAEWAELFAMLALVNGDRVAPDAPLASGMEQLNTMGGKTQLVEGRTERHGDRPKFSTAPESLRVMAPVKPAAVEKPPRILSDAQRKGPPQTSNIAKLAPCGTKTARRRHTRNGEHCVTCEDMKRVRGAGVDAKGQRATCGTLAGYKQHYKNHEKRCAACNEAYNAARRKKRAQKNPTQHREVCGSSRGYDTHRRHGEKACEPCRLAENARSAQRRQAAA